MGLDLWYNSAKSNDFLLEISKLNIPGHYCYNKFGANFDVASSTEETIWNGGGLYSYLAAASILKVSSESANDTAAGTGARVVKIHGLKSDWSWGSETIILNGQTAVTTVNTYIRIFRAMVTSAGSGGQNAGNIWVGTGTVTAGVPANKYAKIDYSATLLSNQTLMAVFTVPLGYGAIINYMDVYVEGGRKGRASLLARSNGTSQPFQLKRIIPLKDTADRRPFGHWTALPEKTDIEIRGINEEAALTIFFSATFDMVLFKTSNDVPDLQF